MRALLALAVAAAAGAPIATQQPPSDRGQVVFESVCATCHAWQPPPDQAPPMAMVVRHYLQRYATQEEAATALALWIAEPDTARMVLPRHAVDRFGTMPPQDLPESDREAVVRYLLGRAAAAGPAMRGGAMHHGGGHHGGRAR